MTIEDAVALEDRVVRIKDARKHFKGCIPGWQMFSERHGFVWKDVIRHGLLSSQLLATNDAMATELVKSVYEDML